ATGTAASWMPRRQISTSTRTTRSDEWDAVGPVSALARRKGYEEGVGPRTQVQDHPTATEVLDNLRRHASLRLSKNCARSSSRKSTLLRRGDAPTLGWAPAASFSRRDREAFDRPAPLLSATPGSKLWQCRVRLRPRPTPLALLTTSAKQGKMGSLRPVPVILLPSMSRICRRRRVQMLPTLFASSLGAESLSPKAVFRSPPELLSLEVSKLWITRHRSAHVPVPAVAAGTETLSSVLEGAFCQHICSAVLESLGRSASAAALLGTCKGAKEAVFDDLEPLCSELHLRKNMRQRSRKSRQHATHDEPRDKDHQECSQDLPEDCGQQPAQERSL
ncbi:unnamed protein product, partial [Polarella glacialis]